MNTEKWLFRTLMVFTLISGLSMMSAFLFNWHKNKSDGNRETQSAKKSKSSAQLSAQQRDLELGYASDTRTEVIDEPSALFNDPAIKQAWGLRKSDAARAWSISHGSRDVIVAVIDTGIDENHEDLKSNIWTNPGETGLDAKGRDKASNGVDDDDNGFIDDVHGWNFVSNNNNLKDNHGHGTHIAGIIGAEANNKKGIIGIAPEVSLMVLKYYDPTVNGTDNLKNTIRAMQYAVKMGAHIINYSGGGTEFSHEEQDAVLSAEKKGILFVAAAGNEKSNSDQFHYYPADYKLKNIISVTAIDPTTEVLPSSNYGVETVDIAAPGYNILSCLPKNSYGLMTGTSQATAFVTGAAVLVMAHKKLYFQAEEIKKYILATGESSSSLSSKTRTSRQLNLFKALTILEGQKMAFSGSDSSGLSEKDRMAFTYNGSAPASGRDPNLPNAKSQNMADVIDLMQALKKEKPKKVLAGKEKLIEKINPEAQAPDRLGEKNNPNEN
jgi:thermitase